MNERVTFYLFSTVILVIAKVSGAVEFGDKFIRCSLSDKNLDQCLNKAISNTLILCGSKGIPSINLAPIEPLKITKIQIGAGTGAVNLVQYYDNVTTYGISKQVLTDTHIDLDKKELTFTTVHDEIKQVGTYNINGKILVLPVQGNGDSTIQLKDATLIHKIIFKEETVKGKRYFKVDQYILKIGIKGAHYEFLNLFNGDKRLGDNINKVINENWDVIFNDIQSGVEKTYGEVFKQVAASVFDHIPVDEIFLT